MTESDRTKLDSFHLSIEQEIAWLAIDVPDVSMNILKATFAEEMATILTSLNASAQQISGLVIYSRKPDNFIAGADIAMIDHCASVAEATQLAQLGQDIFQQIAVLPFPVIAAIHGPCLGGGLELALACDLRICSDDPQTCFGFPEVQLGLLPGSGGTQRFPRLVGLLPALNLILTGRKVRVKEAVKLGIVNASVDRDGLLDAARRMLVDKTGVPCRRVSWIAQIQQVLFKHQWVRHWVIAQARKKAQQKARHHYPAIDVILDVIQFGLDHGMTRGLVQEAQSFGLLAMTSESCALRALFLGITALKHAAKTNGLARNGLYHDNGRYHAGEHQAELHPEEPYKKGPCCKDQQIAVLGGGLMGAGIAYVTVDKTQCNVRVKDISHSSVLHVFQYISQRLDHKQRRGQLSAAIVRAKMARLSGGIDFSGFATVDIVIEAVFETLSLKQEMVQAIESQTRDTTIFATNTSSLPIHQIAAKAQRPENIIGLHYFSPVEKMPLVEVIPHQQTSGQTLSAVIELAYAQGKTPIVVKDSAGFYVNRILALYINGAIQCLFDGEPIEKIDQALVDFGFPVGPLTLLDEVGFDVAMKISPILVEDLGPRFQGPDPLARLVTDGRKGRKSGRGFYRYQSQQKFHREKKHVDPDVYALLQIQCHPQQSATEIAQRCLLPLLNEAVRCLDDGVIQCPRDGDIGAILGIGFPPFIGGPFRYLDDVSVTVIIEQMGQFQGEAYQPCDGLLARMQSGETFYSQH